MPCFNTDTNCLLTIGKVAEITLFRQKIQELHYELCAWIISYYDIGYHQLNMATDVAIPVTTEGVSNVMGIPSNGEEIVVHTKRGTSNRTYTISLLEQNLEDLTMGDDFRKTFLIFACATLLAPNSKLEGMHDLWDTIWDGDVGVQKNWLQFVFHYIENGIREYRKNQPTYIRSCLIFLQVQIIPNESIVFIFSTTFDRF